MVCKITFIPRVSKFTTNESKSLTKRKFLILILYSFATVQNSVNLVHVVCFQKNITGSKLTLVKSGEVKRFSSFSRFDCVRLINVAKEERRDYKNNERVKTQSISENKTFFALKNQWWIQRGVHRGPNLFKFHCFFSRRWPKWLTVVLHLMDPPLDSHF